MNVRDFEQHFLELIFRTNLRLTPHVVAYRLGLSVRETREHLDRLARDGVAAVEVDANGVLSYEVPGAERPSRDLLAAEANPAPAPPLPQGPGQWFAGPALSSAAPVARPARLASPRPSLAWLWLPALLAGGLFFLPLFFTLCFLVFQDFFGLVLFFLLGFSLMRLVRATSCRASLPDDAPRVYRIYRNF